MTEVILIGRLTVPRELHPENLIPTNRRTKEEARELGRKGGIKSGQVRKEKKMLSEYYNELLAKKFKVKIGGQETEKLGAELILDTLMKVMKRGDSASISAIKEIREATEGSKVHNTGTQTISITNAEQVKEIINKLDV